MDKRLMILSVVTVMAAFISLSGGQAVAGPPPTGDRYVDDNGLCGGNTPCYTTINAAIGDASNGEIVVVYPGTYTEQVEVNKNVAVIGVAWPVVVGAPKAFNITATGVVTGFHVKQTPTNFGVGNDVIMVYDAEGAIVQSNKVSGAGPYITWQDKNPGPGITVLISGDVTVEDNFIHHTTGAGIWFGSSTNSVIGENIIVDTQYTGILLPDWLGHGPSHDNLIVENRVRSAGNLTMVYDDGIRLGAGAYDNIVEYNHVVGSVKSGIHAVSSTQGNTIQYNKMRGNGGPSGAGFDAYDQSSGSGTAGTANTWTGNQCNTCSPDGLCD